MGVSATATFRSANDLHVDGTNACTRCCEESPFQVSYENVTVRANYTLTSAGDTGTAELTADLGVPVTNTSAVYVSLMFEQVSQCALYNGEGGPLNHTAIVASPFSTLPERVVSSTSHIIM